MKRPYLYNAMSRQRYSSALYNNTMKTHGLCFGLGTGTNCDNTNCAVCSKVVTLHHFASIVYYNRYPSSQLHNPNFTFQGHHLPGTQFSMKWKLLFDNFPGIVHNISVEDTTNTSDKIRRTGIRVCL